VERGQVLLSRARNLNISSHLQDDIEGFPQKRGIARGVSHTLTEEKLVDGKKPASHDQM
jgi:hypothetical protein